MAYHIIYFIVALTYGLWVVSMIYKNEILMIFASLLMFPLSIYIFISGMDIFDNFLTTMFAAITFAIAAYSSSQATLSLIQQNY